LGAVMTVRVSINCDVEGLKIASLVKPGRSAGRPIRVPRSCVTIDVAVPISRTPGVVARNRKSAARCVAEAPFCKNPSAELNSQFASSRETRYGFVRYYNEVRPHQAKGCPPMHVWRTLDKATPTLAGQQLLAKTSVRHDRVDDTGAVTLRYRRRLHHISIGRRYKGRRVIILMADLDVRVVTDDGELIRHLTLNPTKNYQPRKDD